MSSFCFVVDCSKRAERDRVRFFKILKALKNRGERLDTLSKEVREAWIQALKRGDLSETFLNNARICENHFVSGQPAKLEDKDSPDWAPSVNMGYVTIKTPDDQSMERHVRSVKRQTKRLKMDGADEVESSAMYGEPRAGPSTEPVESFEQCDNHKGRHSVVTQIDLDMDHFIKLSADLNFANQKEEEKLKSSDLSEESFKDNDTKTYLTGFPKAGMMFIVFNSVAAYISSKSVLSPFKQFLLTLMKLRLNLPFKYLSYRFGIAPSTTSDIFYK